MKNEQKAHLLRFLLFVLADYFMNNAWSYI